MHLHARNPAQKGPVRAFQTLSQPFACPAQPQGKSLSAGRKQIKGLIKGLSGGAPPLQNGGGWAHQCRFFSPWEWLTTPTTLPLKRGGVEETSSTKFFLFSSLPAPLGPMAWAKKPSKAGQKLRKRGFSGGGAPSRSLVRAKKPLHDRSYMHPL